MINMIRKGQVRVGAKGRHCRAGQVRIGVIWTAIRCLSELRRPSLLLLFQVCNTSPEGLFPTLPAWSHLARHDLPKSPQCFLRKQNGRRSPRSAGFE